MLSIQPTSPQKSTPNLLPARINHNGPINHTQRYWAPSTDEKGKPHVYFRGRHLHGTKLTLPPNYTGAVLCITDRLAPAPAPLQNSAQTGSPSTHAELDDASDADMEDGTPEEVKIAEQLGEFDEIVVWGHGGEVDEGSDMFVRGVREWIGFAEAMHCEDDEAGEAAGDGAKTP